MHQLIEKDTETKLSILFKKNFYDVAIKIARNQQYSKEIKEQQTIRITTIQT